MYIQIDIFQNWNDFKISKIKYKFMKFKGCKLRENYIDKLH